MSNPAVLAKQLAKIKAAYARQTGPNGQPRNPVIVQSELRMEALMSTSATSFRFFPGLSGGANNGNPFATEIRLDLNDVFFVNEINLQVAAPSGASDGAYRLYNYAPASVFNTSGAAAAISGVYTNGVLNINKDQVLYVQNWQLRKHLKAPIIQDGLTFGFTTTGGTAPNGVDSLDGSLDGFYPLLPGINFSGKDNVQININIPSAMAAIQNANARFVLTFRGYKAFQAA